MLQITLSEYKRLQRAMCINNKHSIATKKWTPEMEMEIVHLLQEGVPANRIKHNKRVSSKKVIDIRKKYGFWGV